MKIRAYKQESKRRLNKGGENTQNPITVFNFFPESLFIPLYFRSFPTISLVLHDFYFVFFFFLDLIPWCGGFIRSIALNHSIVDNFKRTTPLGNGFYFYFFIKSQIQRIELQTLHEQ